MTTTNEIAKLFATLGFNVETKNLDAFEKKLDQLEQRMVKLRSVTSEAIKLNITVSDTALKNIGKNIRAAVKEAGASSEIQINKINVSASAIRAAFHTNAKDLGIKISQVLLPKHLINKALTDAAVEGKIKFSKVNITAKSLKDAMKSVASDVQLNINKIWIGKKPLQDALNAASTNLKLNIVQVHVNEHALRQQLDNILARYRGMINPHAAGSPGRATGGATSPHRMAFGGGMVGGALSNVGGLVGGAATAYGLAGANNINQQLQAIDLAMGAVAGSSEEAAEKLKMLDSMSVEMGKNLRDIAPMYTQILASSRGKALEPEVDNVFRGFMKYGTVMGLDSEAMKGSFRAIAQMTSKGQVYAEELRGQLAERMPGAVEIAATVMTDGDTKKLNKMMEEGKLDPNELIPKMAAEMERRAEANDAYKKSLDSTRVAQGRFGRQLEQTIKLFAESGFDRGMKTFFDTLSSGLADNEEFVKRFGAAFEWAMNQLWKFGDLAKAIITKITELGESIGLTKEQMIILTGVIGGLLLPFTRFFTLLGLVAVAIEDIYAYSQGRGSLFGDWFEGLTPERQEMFKSFASSMVRLGKAIGSLAAMVGEGWILLLQSLWNSPIPEATISGIQMFADAISTLVEALVAMGEQDFSKLGDLGKALVWGTLRTFTGSDDAYEFLANGAGQVSNGIGAVAAGAGKVWDARWASDASIAARQQMAVTQQNLTIPNITIDMTDAVIGSREEAGIIGKALADQFIMELDSLKAEKQRLSSAYKDGGG